MAGGAQRGRGPIADINVTPLVDVVLVLLIIFMVVTNLDEPEAGAEAIPIDLPAAATGQAVEREPLTVAVASSGQLVLRGALATPDAVVTAVREAMSVEGDALEVVVSADREARHERFVALLDLLRAEGVTRFAIQTDGAGG